MSRIARKGPLGASVLIACAAVAVSIPAARAWEAATTHAGLTERAATTSWLHTRLRDQLGLDRGLFTPLTVPPADAPALFEVLRALNPTHGYVPDTRGRLLALGWLAAGSVVADVPRAHALNHFYDPMSKQGARPASVSGVSDRLRHSVFTRLAGEDLPGSGIAAPDWVVHPDNPMGLSGYLDQYAKAIRARTPGERSRHAAGALLAAGAILHVLQDMGSPSHVRDDLEAHLDVIGQNNTDVGSRRERIAALAYGRLGVPRPRLPASAAGGAVDRDAAYARFAAPTLRAFFTADDGSGLADVTSARWFSRYTVPRPLQLRDAVVGDNLGPALTATLRRPLPTPPLPLDFHAARSSVGARLVSPDGVCLARYRIRQNTLLWDIDDECIAEQVAIILPEVVGRSAALLDWLLRGTLTVAPAGKELAIDVGATALGAGTLEAFWDDGRGVRTALGAPTPIQGAAADTTAVKIPRPPADARAVAVLFRGVDAAGQPLVAARTAAYPLAEAAK